MKTSLLMSIYHKNSVAELKRCFLSIHSQVYFPEEIVLVIDGPVGNALSKEIFSWVKILPLEIYWFKVNKGLANALNFGLKKCTHDWVFRMDIDDVCVKDRFIKQKTFIQSNLKIDVLGGNINTFKNYPNLLPGRRVPYSEVNIRRYLRFRNPLNHPTILFNKQRILSIGGYPNARIGQDYLLWINAVYHDFKIRNIDEVLVYMQVNNDTLSRRGLSNFKSDSYPYIYMYRKGITNIFELITGLFLRFAYCTYASIRSIF